MLGQKKHSDVKGSIKSKTSKQGFTKKAGQFGNQNPEKSHHAMQRGFRTARTSATLESDGTSDAEEPTNSDSRQPESETGRPPSERASDSESTSEDEAQPGAVRSKTSRTKETRESKRRRYILFVGNLPFTATPEDITGHFQKRGVPVKEVRMLTKKETGEPRGCCFLEFDSSKRLQVTMNAVFVCVQVGFYFTSKNYCVCSNYSATRNIAPPVIFLALIRASPCV